MAFKLIIFGVLWLAAIAMITYGAFLYFNSSQHLSHKKTMYKLKNGDDE